VDDTHAAGGRLIAVGTTVMRALETVARRDGVTHAGHGRTRLRVMLGTIGWASPALAMPPTEALCALDGRLSGRCYQTASGKSMPRRSSALSGRSGSTWHQRRNS
jgi:hypothetical protein